MVQYELRFVTQIVGPYGLFSGPSGQFTVGREVNASSHLSEVSEFVSNAPRFSSICELDVEFDELLEYSYSILLVRTIKKLEIINEY